MLLVHDVTAHQTSVFIYKYGTVATLVDRDNIALRNSDGIVGIAKFVVGLLLLVVCHHTLVGYRGPEILMTVDIDDIGLSLNAHTGINLLHVALKILRLWMIDAETCRCLNPQCSLQRLLHTDDIAVG